MFKRKFDRVKGEERKCKKCDEIFYTYKPVWQCPKCAARQVAACIKHKFEPKVHYPFNNKDQYGVHGASRRFTQIRQRLNKCKTREELTAHYDRQLKEIEENGVMQWIRDDRSNYIVKKLNVVNKKDYPDTRGHYE